MNGRLFGSLKTLPASAGLGVQLPDLQHLHRVLEREQAQARATLKKSGVRSVFEDCRRFFSHRKFAQTHLNQHKSSENKPKPEQNHRIAALSAALNAEKGARARAVHLVVVEQTLLQDIFGGLNAVPIEVLKQAIPQLVGLPSFRSCLELKLLLQCMHQIVETHAQLSMDPRECKFNELPDDGRMRRQSEPPEDEARIERSRRRSWEPVEKVTDDDDDFPDTQAFSDNQADIPLPMPPVDRTLVMGNGGK